MKVLVALALLALPLSCSSDSTAPPPPNGLAPGNAAWTHEKDGEPATRISDSGTARFDPACPSYIHLVNVANVDFIGFLFALHTRVEKSSYSLANFPDSLNHIVEVYGTITNPFTTPPVPTTGQLTILYVSSTRVDGTFEFRGGADSAGVVSTILVQGSFSATPLSSPPACP